SATGNASQLRPAEDRQRDDHSPYAAVLAECRKLHHDDGTKDERQSEEDIAQASQDDIDPAAVVAGQGADRTAEEHHNDGGEQAYEQRSTRAVDRTGVNVAALQVEAHEVPGTAGLIGVFQQAGLIAIRVDGGEQLRESGNDDDRKDHDRGNDEQRLLAQ